MFLRLWLLGVLFLWDLDLFLLWLFLDLLLGLLWLSLLFIRILLGLLGLSLEILGSSLLGWLVLLWLFGGLIFVL